MIYLDNAATTKPSKAAAEAMMDAVEHFGNPSSLHGLGLDTEKMITSARKKIAAKLGVNDKNILFTSGGTEANNTVIFGTAASRHKIGRRLITSKTEHPSVLEAFYQLERDGYDVQYIDAHSDGRIDLDMLEDCLNADTTLVSVMHVNNETGVIQPLADIKGLILKKAPNAHFHSDCVQSFGKIDINPVKMGIDIATVSAHKIHGFKGTGALYASDLRMLRPIIFGGEQQDEIRPGTENTGGIFAFGAAADEADTDNSYLLKLRTTMRDSLLEMNDIKINGSDVFNSGSVLNVSFIGVKAEVLLHALEARGVYVSTGSACSSHKPQPSHVLGAMGLSRKEIEGAVRFSFDRSNTLEEIETAAEIVKEEVAKIRR